jgi:hypothetical protein
MTSNARNTHRGTTPCPKSDRFMPSIAQTKLSGRYKKAKFESLPRLIAVALDSRPLPIALTPARSCNPNRFRGCATRIFSSCCYTMTKESQHHL